MLKMKTGSGEAYETTGPRNACEEEKGIPWKCTKKKQTYCVRLQDKGRTLPLTKIYEQKRKEHGKK